MFLVSPLGVAAAQKKAGLAARSLSSADLGDQYLVTSGGAGGGTSAKT